MTQAKIKLSELLPSQADRQDINTSIDIPIGEFLIDASEQFTGNAQSVADTAGTNVKTAVATNSADHDFVYKKNDNFIVLLFKLKLPPNFKIEDATELMLGFQMTTSSEKGQQDPFAITAPVLMNLGLIKLDVPQ